MRTERDIQMMGIINGSSERGAQRMTGVMERLFLKEMYSTEGAQPQNGYNTRLL